MHNISKKTCFPSTRKVLDFDLNGQHMRKTEVPEGGNWVLGCSPDHSTIRPKNLSLKSQPSPKDKSERLASRRKVVSSGFHSLVVLVFLLILSIVHIYFVQDCSYLSHTYCVFKGLFSVFLLFILAFVNIYLMVVNLSK